MRRIISGAAVALMLALAGCNMSTPPVTPTLAPTRTAAPTQPITNTPFPTLAASRTGEPTVTSSLTPTLTLTPIPTDTRPPTITHTPSETRPPTLTPLPIIPTDTPTETLTPIATNTPSLTPTGTPSPSLTPSITPTFTASATSTPPPPTATPSLDGSATQKAQIAGESTINAATLTAEFEQIAATITQMAVNAPTRPPTVISTQPPALVTLTPLPQPTLDVTPIYVTAAPGTSAPPLDAPTVTPPIGGGEAEGRGDLETITPQPAAPTFEPTPLFEPINPDPLIQFAPADRSYALSTSGGLRGDAFALPGGAFTFAQNPVNPEQFARVAQNGSLFVVNGAGDPGARLSASPFSEFEPGSPETNNARVTLVRWSPDGRYVAFLIDTLSDESTDNNLQNDGIYFFEPGLTAPHALFRSCPPELSCQLVRHDAGPYEFRPVDFEWNSSSTALLIRLHLEDNAPAFALVPTLTSTNPAELPRIYRYEYAMWSNDGTRVLASGAGEDGMIGVRWIDVSTGAVTPIYNASANGGWIGYAAETPAGVIGLGTESGAGSPLSLMSANGTSISAPMGNVAPERVAWSPDRTAVLIVTNENEVRRYFVARINGTVEEITGVVAGALAVEWVSAPPP